VNRCGIPQCRCRHDFAIESYLKAIQILENGDDKSDLARVTIELGNLYQKREELS
jgi:hypothetical protein